MFLNICKKISYTYLTVFIVDLLATSGDITMTWTSPVLVKLESDDLSQNPLGRKIDSDEDAWIASLINIGAIVGPIPYAFLAMTVGRRIALLAIAVPHIISYLTFAFAEDIALYYFGRVLGGVAVGGGYTVILMYFAEITEDSNRGALSVSINVFWALGNLLPYVIGPYTSIKVFNIILACFPTAFFVLFFIFGPESPYFLMSKNRKDDAHKALMKLRSDENKVEKELAQIELTLQRHEDGSIWDLFTTRKLRNALFISLGLMALNQMNGINAIAFYLQPILDNVDGIDSDMGSVICGIVTFLASFISYFLTDRWGRKPLLILSSFATGVSLVFLATYFYFQDSTDYNLDSVNWLPILGLIAFIISFYTGVSALPWTVSAELFPNKVKGISSITITSACWIFSFILTRFFNDMNRAMTMAGSFWFFAGWSFLGGFFCIFFVPETKGKSLDEIQDLL